MKIIVLIKRWLKPIRIKSIIKKIERFSFFLLFKFFRKTYLVELILDGLSDFHQNWLISSADHAGKDLWNLNRLVK